MTRSEEKADLVRQLGAKPVVADALDADAVGQAIGAAEPEVVVHQLTAIPWSINPRKFDRDFALTNRLRTEGTDHLIAAAKAAGARRFVAQSFAGWPFERPVDRSRARTTRLTRTRRRRCAPCWTPSSTSSAR